MFHSSVEDCIIMKSLISSYPCTRDFGDFVSLMEINYLNLRIKWLVQLLCHSEHILTFSLVASSLGTHLGWVETFQVAVGCVGSVN